MEDDTDELEDNLKHVVYANWKSNTPVLYDLVLMHSLLWPSLTVQWLPDKTAVVDEDYSIQHCLLGTQTSGAGEDRIMIADLAIPVGDVADGEPPPDSSARPPSGFEAVPAKFTIHLFIPHEGDVNKARYMPQHTPGQFPLVASKAVSGEVLVFDSNRYDTKEGGDAADAAGLDDCCPDLRLTGHASEGYGLAWSHLCEGLLLSGSDDALVATWDISSTPRDKRSVPALSLYRGHTDVVEDVAWHHFNRHVFGSVGDDKQLILWDTRKPPEQGVLVSQRAHDREVNSLSFNPFNPHLLATSSSDRSVALRDWRNLAEPLHMLEAHTDEVVQVTWSPQHPTVLGSAGVDRRLNIWDISRIGAQQSAADAEDGPPELMFVHAGQAARLHEFSWNTNDDYVIAGVTDDNVLQVWQMAECIRSTGTG